MNDYLIFFVKLSVIIHNQRLKIFISMTLFIKKHFFIFKRGVICLYFTAKFLLLYLKFISNNKSNGKIKK